MMRLILLLVPAIVSAKSPASDRTALMTRMRDAALTYADHLQDFLCTELMTRSADQSGSGKHYKLLETQELELGYITHQEHYRLLKVNGKTTDLDKRVKQGYWKPGGEFGSALRSIFDPKSAAQFEWDHEESSAGTRSCVFRYRVAAATRAYIIQADADHVGMALRGSVTADCDTGEVTHIVTETEPASVKRGTQDVAIGMQLDLRYGPVPIGSNTFLLPQDAIEIGIFGKTLTKAEIKFQQYRKYDSNSNIVFDDGSLPAK